MNTLTWAETLIGDTATLRELIYVARFLTHVQRDGECWRWTAHIGADGYGQVQLRLGERRSRRAHIVSYETFVAPVPPGLSLDHLCRNRWCVNPAHLEPVTQRENIRRGQSPSAIAARAGTCTRGHPTAEHGYRRKSNGEIVYCNACLRERADTNPNFAESLREKSRRYRRRVRAS